MRFDVLSRQMAEQFNPQEKHISISIRDIDCKNANLPEIETRVDVLFLTFSDLDRIKDSLPYKLKHSLFNKGIAELIWEFVDKYKDEVDLIVINCEAGISRSSAVAAAISKILNGNDDDFFKYFIPNRLVYRKMMEVKS